MKYLLLLLMSQPCFATEYRFTFNIPLDGKMNTLKYKTDANTRSQALEKAGVFCGDFFGIGKRDLTTDEVDAIIDGCANPTFN
jgi:hypothetical protein